MKKNLQEILRIITPETPIEEIIAYCDTVEDFNKIFEEYAKLQALKKSTP